MTAGGSGNEAPPAKRRKDWKRRFTLRLGSFECDMRLYSFSLLESGIYILGSESEKLYMTRLTLTIQVSMYVRQESNLFEALRLCAIL